MAKILKIFIIVLAIFVVSCAHHPPPELDNRTKAELDEIYPITGIPFTEFESLLRDIKEYIPPDAAILSVGIAEHNNVARVITGKYIGPEGGTGTDYLFEKIEGSWKFLKKTAWSLS